MFDDPAGRALVMGQIAMSMVLLIGALLIRSFAQLRGVDPGFSPDHLLTMKLALPVARYDTATKASRFFLMQLHECGYSRRKLRGDGDDTAHHHLDRTNIFSVERAGARRNDPLSFAVLQVTPDYFRTLGLRADEWARI